MTDWDKGLNTELLSHRTLAVSPGPATAPPVKCRLIRAPRLGAVRRGVSALGRPWWRVLPTGHPTSWGRSPSERSDAAKGCSPLVRESPSVARGCSRPTTPTGTRPLRRKSGGRFTSRGLGLVRSVDVLYPSFPTFYSASETDRRDRSARVSCVSKFSKRRWLKSPMTTAFSLFVDRESGWHHTHARSMDRSPCLSALHSQDSLKSAGSSATRHGPFDRQALPDGERGRAALWQPSSLSNGLVPDPSLHRMESAASAASTPFGAKSDRFRVIDFPRTRSRINGSWKRFQSSTSRTGHKPDLGDRVPTSRA